jgi:hypothetical protein
MAGRSGELRRCYERYLKTGSGGGRAVAMFALRSDGSVAKATVHGFSRSLDACLCDVVARAKFPTLPGGGALVSYPIAFTPE